MVPNSQLLEQIVINWTLVDRMIRSKVRVGVSYGSPVRRVEELVGQAVREQEEINIEPAPVVVFDDFGENALIFETYFWCDVSGERDLRKIRSNVRHRISELFEAEGIVIAYPQRDIHLTVEQPLPVRLLQAAEDSDDRA